VFIVLLVAAGIMAAKFLDEALDVRAHLEAAKSRLGPVAELVKNGDAAEADCADRRASSRDCVSA